MEKRKGLLAARESARDIMIVPCPGLVTALHRQGVSHLQSHFLFLASVSLRERLINACRTDKQGLVRSSLGDGKKGGGAKEEALSLSWQGVAGGDSEEERFVVGIHFPWLSWGSCWSQRCERDTAVFL